MVLHSDLEVEIKSDHLKDKKIVICCGGGIAAIEIPKIARELRRAGARVRCVVTENCLKFIGKTALEWATNNVVAVEAGGSAEHICSDDAVLIFPATADLISKISLGICSDAVSTLVQSAIGQNKPILIFPSMHLSLKSSVFIDQHREKLKQNGNISIVDGLVSEGKEKSLDARTVCLETAHHINRKLNTSQSSTQRALIVFGGTRTMIDGVRCVANLSTGELGTRIAENLYASGFKVTGIKGNTVSNVLALKNQKIINAVEYADMEAECAKILSQDYAGVFLVAAISDFTTKERQTSKKIKSAYSEELDIKLVRTKKIIALESIQKIPYKMACKVTEDETADSKKIAHEFMQKMNLNELLWNSIIQAFQNSDKSETKGTLISNSTHFFESIMYDKSQIANTVCQNFLKFYKENNDYENN